MILTQHGINSLKRKDSWILLNNCNTVENNYLKSLVGSSFGRDGDYLGSLEQSNIFSNENSFRRSNAKYIRCQDFELDSDILTVEWYISNIPSLSLSGFLLDAYFLLGGTVLRDKNCLYIGGSYFSNIDSSFPHLDGFSAQDQHGVNINQLYQSKAHIVFVYYRKQKKVYTFFNGVFVFSANYDEDRYSVAPIMSQNGNSSSAILEFMAVRRGDFSNNLQSFTVPTSKYTLEN